MTTRNLRTLKTYDGAWAMDGQPGQEMGARNRGSDPYVGDDWSMTSVITPKPGNQDRAPLMHARLRKLGTCLYAPDSASSAPAVSKLRISGGIGKPSRPDDLAPRPSHVAAVRIGHYLPSSRRDFCGLTEKTCREHAGEPLAGSCEP